MSFAGDMPTGAYARFMKANFDRLIDGAVGAAENCRFPDGEDRPPPELALLISCVGRKLVLKQRVEEEVEGVREILGEDTVLAGFYSNGEISPFTPSARCQLHNQTMTITTFSETSAPETALRRGSRIIHDDARPHLGAASGPVPPSQGGCASRIHPRTLLATLLSKARERSD